MDDRGLHPNVFVFVFYFINVSRWVVAASFMAENPNMGVAIFVADITHLCVVSGRMELLPSFLGARLSTAAVISLSSPVLRCCFRALLTLCDQLQGPPRT